MNNNQPHEFMRFAAGADYRHVCAECIHPRRHTIHGFEPGQDREPVRVGHPDNDPPTVGSVLAGYRAIIDTIDEYNEMVEEGDRVHVPFGVQEVLANYIAERRAIASLTGEEA